MRGVPAESLKGYRDMMLGSVEGKSPESLLQWSKRQVYLALGTLLTSAALLHIDACPMEGFDPSGFVEVLGLREQGLAATVLCPVGYRLEQDAYAGAKKVRFAQEDVIIKR